MKTKFAAIDPGKTGAIATDASGELEIWDMPATKAGEINAPELSKICQGLLHRGVGVVFVEQQFLTVGRDKQGNQQIGKGTTKNLTNFGIVQGVVGAFGLEVVLIDPKRWRPGVGVKIRGSSHANNKRKSLETARLLFPEVAEELFKLQKHDGRAEATLILHYGASHWRMRQCG